MVSITIEREVGGIDGLYRPHGVALYARHLDEAANGVTGEA